jgi:hypothetical protein
MHGPFPYHMRSMALAGRAGDIPRRRRLSCACRPGERNRQIGVFRIESPGPHPAAIDGDQKVPSSGSIGRVQAFTPWSCRITWNGSTLPGLSGSTIARFLSLDTP